MVVGGRELIDTLWNVNFPVPHASLIALLELIDTLWNVNKEVFADAVSASQRINRYIMECKCHWIKSG